MKIYKDIDQGSIEWLRLRLGMITGSRMRDVMKADNLPLIDKLIAEKVCEDVEETFVTDIMQRGIDMEPIAREEYQKEVGLEIEQIGFAVSNKYEWLGYSPDGLIKIDGKYKRAIEIKCPNTSTHVRYIRQNKLPFEYKDQIYCGFLVCQDLEQIDFVSYDNRFYLKPLHIVSVFRNEITIELEQAEESLLKFWEKFNKYYKQITF